jgi:hypothetical protein
MRHVLTILLALGLLWVGVKFRNYFSRRMAEEQAKVEGPARTAPGKLPGLSPDLEPSLEAAKKRGADGLREWLRQHRSEVEDPRLADIDLDYVVLVGRSKPEEARRVLDAIRARITPTSPVYKRLQQLDKAYH